MTNSLPFHGFLVHPHTGLPLRAVGMRRNGAPIWPIIGASEDDAGGDGTGAGETSAGGGAGSAAGQSGDPEGAEHLGDKGKKALDEMKAKWRAAEALAKENNEKLAALQAQVAGTEAEHKAQQEAQRVKDEALSAANTRILKAEVRAAATGKLSDPADALQFLDLSKLEVSDDGEVDGKAVAAAIDDLIKNKPYLAAQGKRFQGGGDGGTRKESDKSITDQIAEARKARNFPLAIALEEKRAADLAASK